MQHLIMKIIKQIDTFDAEGLWLEAWIAPHLWLKYINKSLLLHLQSEAF